MNPFRTSDKLEWSSARYRGATRASGPVAGPARASGSALGPVRASSSAPGPVRGLGLAQGPVRASGLPPGPVRGSGVPPGPERASGLAAGPVRASGLAAGPVRASGPAPGLLRASGPVPGPVRASGLAPGPVRASGLPPGPVRGPGLAVGPVRASGLVPGPVTGSAAGPMQLPKEGPKEPKLKIVGGFKGFYVHVKDGVEVVRCPLVKTHMLKLSRLQHHLKKCLETYQGDKLRCPYNATEWVNPHDWLAHLQVCKSRLEEKLHFKERNLPRNLGLVQHTAPYDYYGDESDSDW